MHPATMQTISTEQGREMREQAAAWRRARQEMEPGSPWRIR